MAKATKKTVTTEEITLILTKEEGDALSTLFGGVGGHPETTRRGLISRVSNALFDVGCRAGSDCSGVLYFKEQTNG